VAALNLVFPKNRAEMDMAIGFVVVNAKNVLAEPIFTFSMPS
jgi:hypothetical protein